MANHANKIIVLGLIVGAIAGYCMAYTPPLGIPAPPFGIDEDPNMYDTGADPNVRNPSLTYSVSDRTATGSPVYTHYIDKDHPEANDTNTYGTYAHPRLTIPYPLPYGSICEVNGTGYTYYNHYISGGYYFAKLTSDGNSTSPVFILGLNTPTFQTMWLEFAGTYAILDGFDFNDTRVDTYPVLASKSANHLCVRNCTFQYVREGSTPGSAISFQGLVNYGVAYNNTIHDIGAPNSNPQVDYQGIGVTNGSTGHTDEHPHHIWILNNTISRCGGDSIQVNGLDNAPIAQEANHIYIGGNNCSYDGENAIDLKECNDVIVSQNTVHHYARSVDYTRGSDGASIICEDDAPHANIQIWFNTIHTVTIGIRAQDTCNIIGNLIYNCHEWDRDTWLNTPYEANDTTNGCTTRGTGINGWNPPSGEINMLYNTIVDVDAGFAVWQSTTYGYNLANNIIADANTDRTSCYHACYGTTTVGGKSKAYNNLWYNSFTAVANRFNGADTSNNITGDPNFTNAAGRDYSIGDAAGAGIDNAYEAGWVDTILDNISARYGFNIRQDINGVARAAQSDIGAYEYGAGTPAQTEYYIGKALWLDNIMKMARRKDEKIIADIDIVN